MEMGVLAANHGWQNLTFFDFDLTNLYIQSIRFFVFRFIAFNLC